MFIIVAAAVAYVVHAWRSPRVDKDQRLLWVLVLLLAAPIAMPIYWWLHVHGAGRGRSTSACHSSSSASA